jgi:tellurite resistance protein TehA-like permease
MGLTGLSVAWKQAHLQLGAPSFIAVAISSIAIAAFVLLIVAYGAKIVYFPAAALAEFRHPIAGNLFATLLISSPLLPILLALHSLSLARAMWLLGAFGMGFFSWLIISRWLSERQMLARATPAWIVPVVGVLNVPLALPLLEWRPIDRFAQSLYALMLFLLTVLVARLKTLGSRPFHVLWWVVGFPLPTAAVAALRFARDSHDFILTGIAWLLLSVSTLVIGGLLLRTVVGFARGETGMLSA